MWSFRRDKPAPETKRINPLGEEAWLHGWGLGEPGVYHMWNTDINPHGQAVEWYWVGVTKTVHGETTELNEVDPLGWQVIHGPSEEMDLKDPISFLYKPKRQTHNVRLFRSHIYFIPSKSTDASHGRRLILEPRVMWVCCSKIVNVKGELSQCSNLPDQFSVPIQTGIPLVLPCGIGCLQPGVTCVHVKPWHHINNVW